jgi:acid phosphatase family membrane protein YuiD
MMEFSYVLTPFLAWLVAGLLKFSINSIKAKQLAFGLIGYGGLPSNHSAIVTSMAALIAMKEGLGHPAFGVAITLAFIVILDASSLRRQVG